MDMYDKRDFESLERRVLRLEARLERVILRLEAKIATIESDDNGPELDDDLTIVEEPPKTEK